MEKLKEVGVEVVAFVSVNDVFVMDAWGLGYTPSAQDRQVRMLADPCGNLMRAMGMTMANVVDVLGNERAFRYAVICDDNKITHFELDESGITKTAVENIIKILEQQQ